MKITRLAEGLPVAPLYWALQEHPEFWDEHTGRTAPEDSPHHGLSDIWARFAPPGVNGGEPHEAMWYPVADVLPIKALTAKVFEMVGGKELGGVLITRIKPGQMCKPHTDPGWHARYYEKFAVQITSAPGQEFHFEGESLVSKPGDLFWFDNAFTHWVTNESAYERITAVICIRR